MAMGAQVPPNLRAFRILEELSDSAEPLTPTELTRRLGWPKQTVHRLCQTLVDVGILEKHDRHLCPGRRTNRLALGLANRAAGGLVVIRSSVKLQPRLERQSILRDQNQAACAMSTGSRQTGPFASPCQSAPMFPFIVRQAARSIWQACPPRGGVPFLPAFT